MHVGSFWYATYLMVFLTKTYVLYSINVKGSEIYELGTPIK